MSTSNNQIARQRLDQRIDGLGNVVGPRPPSGWIRAIRDALGMSGSELARRMGITPQALSQIESNERTGSIRLETLERAADALESDVVYAIVPRGTLRTIVEDQAMRKAAGHLTPIAHHSRLEGQTVDDDATRAQLEDLASRFIDKRGLWTEDATA